MQKSSCSFSVCVSSERVHSHLIFFPCLSRSETVSWGLWNTVKSCKPWICQARVGSFLFSLFAFFFFFLLFCMTVVGTTFFYASLSSSTLWLSEFAANHLVTMASHTVFLPHCTTMGLSSLVSFGDCKPFNDSVFLFAVWCFSQHRGLLCVHCPGQIRRGATRGHGGCSMRLVVEELRRLPGGLVLRWQSFCWSECIFSYILENPCSSCLPSLKTWFLRRESLRQLFCMLFRSHWK